MLLGPLSLAFGSLADVRIPRGAIELPFAYGEHVWGLMKGAAHKYIKRVPKPGGGFRYFYKVGGGGGVDSHEHMVEGAGFRHNGGHWHIEKTDGDTLHVKHDESGEAKKVTRAELAGMLQSEHGKALEAHRDALRSRLVEAYANRASPKQIAKLEAQADRAGVPHDNDAASKHHAEADKAAERGDRAAEDRHTAAGHRADAARYRRIGDVRMAERHEKWAEEREKRAGVKADKHEDAVLSEVPEYQRRAYRGDTAKDLRAKAASVRDMAKRAKERNQGGPSYSINDAIQARIDAEKRRHAAEAAEYEANASFLERLADAKDKDAGVGTKPEPTIGGRKASEARVRTADEKSDDYAKDLRDVLARHSAHPDVQEDAKLFFGAATASGSSGRAMPTIDDKHKARPTEKKYPALSRAPAALREEIARLAGAAHREHTKELEAKNIR